MTRIMFSNLIFLRRYAIRTLAKRLIIPVLSIGIFFAPTFIAEADVKEMGEVCFNMWPEVDFEGAGGQLQVGVLSFGRDHFIIEGKIIILEPHGRVYGNAFVDGNKIVMSLTSSNVSSLVGLLSGRVFFFHIILDAITLTGQWAIFDFPISEYVTSVLPPSIGSGTISITPSCIQ